VLKATYSHILVIFGENFLLCLWILGKKVVNIFEKFQQNTTWGVEGYLQ